VSNSTSSTTSVAAIARHEPKSADALAKDTLVGGTNETLSVHVIRGQTVPSGPVIATWNVVPHYLDWLVVISLLSSVLPDLIEVI
jgi:hypothetical protein